MTHSLGVAEGYPARVGLFVYRRFCNPFCVPLPSSFLVAVGIASNDGNDFSVSIERTPDIILPAAAVAAKRIVFVVITVELGSSTGCPVSLVPIKIGIIVQLNLEGILSILVDGHPFGISTYAAESSTRTPSLNARPA
jgi:hypothetical protein